jgi:4-hydroxy-2-oxoheptanedioate aldolase
MGLLGRANHPDVQRELYRAIGACVAAGVPVGTFAAEAAVPDLLRAGASFVAVGTDIGLVSAGARGIVQRFRDTAMATPPSAGIGLVDSGGAVSAPLHS